MERREEEKKGQSHRVSRLEYIVRSPWLDGGGRMCAVQWMLEKPGTITNRKQRERGSGEDKRREVLLNINSWPYQKQPLRGI